MAREMSLGTTSAKPFPRIVITTSVTTKLRYGWSRAKSPPPGGLFGGPGRFGLIRVWSVNRGTDFCGNITRLKQMPERCQVEPRAARPIGQVKAAWIGARDIRANPQTAIVIRSTVSVPPAAVRYVVRLSWKWSVASESLRRFRYPQHCPYRSRS